MGNRTHPARHLLPSTLHVESINCVQGVALSRETTSNVLARNNQNGYQHEFKRWKFFRASEPDELWQIDFKGPFSVQGKKYWFLVCIDDYSRFIIAAEQFEHELTTPEVTAVLEKQKKLPKAILSDHGSQFKEQRKTGVASTVLRLSLLIFLILRTRARLSVASKTSTENSLIHCAGFQDGSKVE